MKDSSKNNFIQGIEKEKESERQNRENLQNKYKEKIASYKTRLAEKENELEAAIAKQKDIEFSMNRKIQELENKLDEQKVKFEHTLSQVEFDSNKFTVNLMFFFVGVNFDIIA